MDSLLEHDPDILRPPWGAYGRDLTLGVVSGAAKLLMRLLNRVSIPEADLARYQELTMRREPGVGLLTYCNHTSTFDDPGLPSALLPWWLFWTEHSHEKMRWTMCARDVCFKNELLRQFFSNGKTLPVERGSSVHQPVMAAVGRLLGEGAWLHVFPEGKVQPGGNVGAFRQGIGKLVCDARIAAGRDPVVLPYFHSGMARIVPYMRSLPSIGHEVSVVVGEPLDLGHITCRCGQAGVDQQEVWRDIAAALRDALLQLEARVPPNPNQLEERPELRDIIAARCRHNAAAAAAGGGAAGSHDDAGSTMGGDSSSICDATSSWFSSSGGDGGAERRESGSGASSSGRMSGALAAAAAALAEPCSAYNPWCHVLSVPYWAPDQERRQLLFAQYLQQRQHAAPWRTVDADEALDAVGAELPAAAAAAAMTAAKAEQQHRQLSRWQRLLRWRQRRAEAAVAQRAAAEAAPPPARRRVWWAWQRAAQHQRQQGAGGGAPVHQHGHSWQGAHA